MALINIMYFSILDEHKINKSPKETNMGRECRWETSNYPGSAGDKQAVVALVEFWEKAVCLVLERTASD